MLEDPPNPAIDLNSLVEALTQTESRHRQDVPLREDMRHIPVGCSCGVRYDPDQGWSQSRHHIREVQALAVVRALHRTCETCMGRGIWRKMRGDLICPDCDGTGRVLTPLPPMVFQDEQGRPWRVHEITATADEDAPDRAWVSRDGW